VPQVPPTYAKRWSWYAERRSTVPTGPTPPATATLTPGWAEPSCNPTNLASAVLDTAHHLAQLALDAGDLVLARWAVERAWLADPDWLDDHPWLDLMRVNARAGNTSELRALIDELVVSRGVEVPEDLSPATYREINNLAADLLRVG